MRVVRTWVQVHLSEMGWESLEVLIWLPLFSNDLEKQSQVLKMGMGTCGLQGGAEAWKNSQREWASHGSLWRSWSWLDSDQSAWLCFSLPLSALGVWGQSRQRLGFSWETCVLAEQSLTKWQEARGLGEREQGSQWAGNLSLCSLSLLLPHATSSLGEWDAWKLRFWRGFSDW